MRMSDLMHCSLCSRSFPSVVLWSLLITILCSSLTVWFYLFLWMKDWLKGSLQECSSVASGFKDRFAGLWCGSFQKCLKQLYKWWQKRVTAVRQYFEWSCVRPFSLAMFEIWLQSHNFLNLWFLWFLCFWFESRVMNPFYVECYMQISLEEILVGFRIHWIGKEAFVSPFISTFRLSFHRVVRSPVYLCTNPKAAASW
jgi:hypothetical protein